MIGNAIPFPANTGNFATRVEEELARGARWLRFSRDIETVYSRETRERRVRRMTVSALLALALYNLFLIADYLLIRDVMQKAFTVRLLIVTPFSVVIYLLMQQGRLARFHDLLASTNVIAVVASTALLIASSQDPNRVIYNQGFLLVILYACLIQRLHFWYGLVCCVLSNAIFTVSLLLQRLTPLEQPICIEITVLLGTAFTLAAAYAMEREHRLFYLITLKERLHAVAMEGISNRDALTGLLNRRALDRRLEELAAASVKAGAAGLARHGGVAVVILDIDHFKIYNDRLGHQAGDDCLRQVARLILSQMREGHDDAFRYGGEEFLLLIREADNERAIAIAERIRRAIEAQAIPHPQSSASPYVTASFGVAHARAVEASPAEVIARADMALYAAKNNGRNRVWPPISFQRPVLIEEQM